MTVTNAADVPVVGLLNLREAIIAANVTPNAPGPPETIDFAPNIFDANGDLTLELLSALPQITEAVWIDGGVPGKNRPVIKPAAGLETPFRIFDVKLPPKPIPDWVSFEKVVVEGGWANTPANPGDPLAPHGGGIRSQDANLNVLNTVVKNNRSLGDGGGVYTTGLKCRVWVNGEGAALLHNQADQNGGGIAVRNSYLKIFDGSRVEDNRAMKSGGGVAVFANNFVAVGAGVPGLTILNLDGSDTRIVIRSNTALDGDGGGVLVKNEAGAAPTANVIDTDVISNQALGVAPPANLPWTSGRGGGIATLGNLTLNGNAGTHVNANGQMAPAVLLGVYVGPGGFDALTNTSDVSNNYQIQ